MPWKVWIDRHSLRWMATAILGALILGGQWVQQGTTQSVESGPFSGNGLILSSRDRLAICVDLSPHTQTSPQVVQGRVSDALVRARLHPRWEQLNLGTQEPEIVQSCPLPPLLTIPANRALTPYAKTELNRIVESASNFRIFLVVLPNPEIEQIFGITSIYTRVASEELVCASHVTIPPACRLATTGVYITDSEFQDSALVEQAILRGLHIAELPSISTRRNPNIRINTQPIRSPVPGPWTSPAPSVEVPSVPILPPTPVWTSGTLEPTLIPPPPSPIESTTPVVKDASGDTAMSVATAISSTGLEQDLTATSTYDPRRGVYQ